MTRWRRLAPARLLVRSPPPATTLRTGGKANLADLALICAPHHTLAHRHGMTMTAGHNGKFRLHRRT